MKRFSRKWINAILALTVGLLLFLFIGTLADGIEIGAEAPAVLQGTMVVMLGAVLTFLLLIGFDQYQQKKQEKKASSPINIALLMAVGIGLHNFGEGLAIGTSFSLGEAALGTFLVIGFTLHNITEGIGIAAPLLKIKPRIRDFVLLGRNSRCSSDYWNLVWWIYFFPNSRRIVLRDWCRCHFTSNLCHHENVN